MQPYERKRSLVLFLLPVDWGHASRRASAAGSV